MAQPIFQANIDYTQVPTMQSLADYLLIANAPATVRAATLTGLSLVDGSDVVAADSVLVALGKLQVQNTELLASLDTHELRTDNPHSVTASQVGAEPAFTKNTGFNKNFGTTAGTVSEGSHTHSGAYEPLVTAGTTSQYYRGDKTWQTLEVEDIHHQSGHTLMGRHAAGAGAGQEVTVDGGLEWSGSGIRRAAVTGDVSIPAGSGTATISNLPYSKLETIGATSLLGNYQVTGAAATSISLGTNFEFSGNTLIDRGLSGAISVPPNSVTASLGSFTMAQLNTAISDGDVVSGAASSTDNAIARFDGVTGKIVQNSSATIDDTGNVSFDGSVSGKRTAGNAVVYRGLDVSGNTSFEIRTFDLGSNNTASGLNALYSTTSGTGNTASGGYALYSNTEGAGNTAIGFNTLYANTGGSFNTASGFSALYFNTTGVYNTVSGGYALHLNTTGYANTASGFNALYSNTTGFFNTASGFSALYSNTTGVYNTASGGYALYLNTTGYANTVSGFNTLYSNTTGSFNTATGFSALFSNTTGVYNTATGFNALYSNTTGFFNTASGAESGVYTNAGGAVSNVSSSVFLGHDTRVLADGDVNEVVIGAGARGKGSNTCVFGNSSTLDSYFDHNLNIGNPTNAARLHVKGAGNAGATVNLALDNSLGTRLVSVLDNGKIEQRTNTVVSANVMMDYYNAGVLRTALYDNGAQAWYLNAGAVGAEVGTIAYTTPAGAPAIAIVSPSATEWALIKKRAGGGLIFNTSSGSSYGTDQVTILPDGGNIGFNTSSPTAAHHVVGLGNTDATKALFLESANGTDLFTVLNDGKIVAHVLPTSSAGLTAGMIWNDSGTLKIV
jgi:hypothetical protein